MKEPGEIKCLDYSGWEIRISLDGLTSEGHRTGHADLWRDGEHRCRIALSGHAVDPSDKLEQKAKLWIDDWKAVDHAGDTGFVGIDD
ncbi:hypothetical protein WKW77_34210 [Variovorax ureilyticus]|uniref:Uncharacterized protein n=1 Tax=Variovorax ureilyticus TaxID=1836198 RepID=A0ABU8VR43_9BURK